MMQEEKEMKCEDEIWTSVSSAKEIQGINFERLFHFIIQNFERLYFFL